MIYSRHNLISIIGNCFVASSFPLSVTSPLIPHPPSIYAFMHPPSHPFRMWTFTWMDLGCPRITISIVKGTNGYNGTKDGQHVWQTRLASQALSATPYITAFGYFSRPTAERQWELCSQALGQSPVGRIDTIGRCPCYVRSVLATSNNVRSY